VIREYGTLAVVATRGPERRETAPARTKVGCQVEEAPTGTKGRVSKFDMGPWVTKRNRLEPGNQDGSSRGWYALLRRR
jgi:hypothetical protein